jgi:hypothetical protein
MHTATSEHVDLSITLGCALALVYPTARVMVKFIKLIGTLKITMISMHAQRHKRLWLIDRHGDAHGILEIGSNGGSIVELTLLAPRQKRFWMDVESAFKPLRDEWADHKSQLSVRARTSV